MPAKKAASTNKTRSSATKSARSSSARSSAKAPTKASARKPAAKRASPSPRTGERLIDHEAIRQWAEERGGTPSCVRQTGGKGDVGMIRLDFPGYSGEETLQPIDWAEWFDKFDENNLALIVQRKTAGGAQSSFNKLVKRTAAERRPRTRAAG